MDKNNNSWLVETIRVTAFGKFDFGSEGDACWLDVFEKEPDSVAHQRGIKQSVWSGQYKNAAASIVAQPSLIQLQLSGNPSTDNFPRIEEWDQVVIDFSLLANRFLKHLTEVSRLAFGVILNKEVENREAGYALLKPLLTAINFEEGMSDLSFQINRPRKSKEVENLTINRLSNWGVASLALLTAMIPATAEITMSNKLMVARTSLDINTTQEFKGILPKEKLNAILQEFIDLAEEILSKGDCK